ncbi:hypothetical protein DER46DRAFT_627991 [Fusarium sp. MPI-SDFR-AT-0072]|nr:hypothetical protein DER46DRAFT_627991 [Fusarium sp. MPI-SDFR-AT-0072]
MRLAESKDLSNLVMWRPLMIINKTLLGPAYVESVVSHSPGRIASQGGKRLPLELWDMIIDFAKRYPEDHRFSLVQPIRLQTSVRGDELFGSLCTFPTALLETAKFLHVNLTVPDIIRHLEDGDCNICSGTRVTGSDILSGFVPRNKECSQLLDGVPPSVAEPLVCPLCVGLNHTWQSINTRNRYVPPMSREDYRSWLVKRLKGFFTRPR